MTYQIVSSKLALPTPPPPAESDYYDSEEDEEFEEDEFERQSFRDELAMISLLDESTMILSLTGKNERKMMILICSTIMAMMLI